MGRDQLADEDDLSGGYCSPAISPLGWHRK
jgi:hypothetical protein